MQVSDLVAGYRDMHAQAPEMPSAQFALRMMAWKFLKTFSIPTTVPLHARSRMRLQARQNERGIRAAIYLYRDHYEPSVRRAIDGFVSSGDICYDIGANLGLWTLRMAEAAGPTGLVYAFEPHPANAAELAVNAALSNSTTIRICEHGLSDRESASSLYVPDDIGRASLAPETSSDEAVAIALRPLDSVWEEQGHPKVAFVKMDVEGAEPLVLRGGTRFFSEVRPVVCCEINPGKLANMGFAPADVLTPFRSWDYVVKIWNGTTLVDSPSDMNWNDVEDLVLMPAPGAPAAHD